MDHPTAHGSRVVHVEIHGHRYPIRSGLPPEYVAELAAYVDEKMRLAARESPAGDTLKIAVLAALNIADEFFRACDEVETDQAALTAAPPRSSGWSTSRSASTSRRPRPASAWRAARKPPEFRSFSRDNACCPDRFTCKIDRGV